MAAKSLEGFTKKVAQMMMDQKKMLEQMGALLSIPYFVWPRLTHQNRVSNLKKMVKTLILKAKSWEQINIVQFTLIRWLSINPK